MSIAEMKLEAINKISSLSEEKALKEIIEHLDNLKGSSKNDTINL